VVDLGRASDLDDHFARAELPPGAWQFAGGHHSVEHLVVIWPGFLDYFSGEEKRIGGGQNHPLSPQTRPDAAGYGLKAAALGPDVVGGVAGLNVFIVRTAVQHHVTVCDGVAGV
jgi:hypothetical protein